VQHHPGFYYYPSMFDNGCIRFPPIDPACDRSSSHLSRYITASYLLLFKFARELTRARTALVAARSGFVPPTIGFTPYVPPTTIPLATPVTPQSNSDTSIVTTHESTADWTLLLGTPTAPML
jgi:hypothetical protein